MCTGFFWGPHHSTTMTRARLALLFAVALGISGVGFATVVTSPLAGPRQASPSAGSTVAQTSVSTSLFCSTTEKYANMTWTEPGLCAGVIAPTGGTMGGLALATGNEASVILGSPQVQAFIKNASDYQVVYFEQGTGDPARAQAIINVTGAQEVSGNWSSGYRVSYAQSQLLNVTVTQDGSSYELTHLSVYNTPDRESTSIEFSAQQQNVIRAAASDPAVASLMTVGGPYYAAYVSPLQNNSEYVGPACPGYSGNSSVGIESYAVQFNQVDGYREVVAYLNNDLQVVSRMTVNQFSGFGVQGLEFTDPWSGIWTMSTLPHPGPSCPV